MKPPRGAIYYPVPVSVAIAAAQAAAASVAEAAVALAPAPVTPTFLIGPPAERDLFFFFTIYDIDSKSARTCGRAVVPTRRSPSRVCCAPPSAKEPATRLEQLGIAS